MNFIKYAVISFGGTLLTYHCYFSLRTWEEILTAVANKLHIVEALHKRFPKQPYVLNYRIRLCISCLAFLVSLAVDLLLALLLHDIIHSLIPSFDEFFHALFD